MLDKAVINYQVIVLVGPDLPGQVRDDRRDGEELANRGWTSLSPESVNNVARSRVAGRDSL